MADSKSDSWHQQPMKTGCSVLVMLWCTNIVVAIPEAIAAENHSALSPLSPAEMESQARTAWKAGELAVSSSPEHHPEENKIPIAPVMGGHLDHVESAHSEQEITGKPSVPGDSIPYSKKDLEKPPKESGTNQPTDSSDEAMIDMIVVSPTVRRFDHNHNPAPDKYLVPMVDKLWNDLTKEQQGHVRIFILNSDSEPDLHIEAESLRDHPGVTVFTKNWQKQVIKDSVAQFSTLEDGREVNPNWVSWVASENTDAAFLFEKAKNKAPYILFLEDDIFPTTKALMKLSSHVKELERTHSEEWLFLDLYTPNLDWAPGMLDVKDGEKYPFQCCTQAMLFKSKNVDGIIQYWNQHPREPIDDNLRNYMKDVHPELGVFAVRPNLFQHVGAYSSNADKSFGVVEHESLDFVPLIL